MIVVHHLENSRSQRILWLLEELGVDYRVKRYDRDRQSGLAPSELLEVHPLGKSPVITDGDRTIAESGTIVEYLAFRRDREIWRQTNDLYVTAIAAALFGWKLTPLVTRFSQIAADLRSLLYLPGGTAGGRQGPLGARDRAPHLSRTRSRPAWRID